MFFSTNFPTHCVVSHKCFFNLPIIEAWKFDIVSHLCYKFKTIWLIVFSAHCDSWERDVLNWKLCCFNTDQNRICIPFYKIFSLKIR